MNVLKRFLLIVYSGLLFCVGCSQPTNGGSLNVGVAKVDITPPVGYPVHKVTSEGVLDPLEARAIVWSDGDRQAALVMADLFYIPLSLSEVVRKRASEKTGIPVSNICLAATHTHADPTCYTEVEEYAQWLDSGKPLSGDKYSYAEQLVERLVNSIAEAQANRKQATIKSGVVNTEGVAFNRRHLMKDGTVKMNGGFLNPDIIGAVGPVDPELGIILFTAEGDEKPFSSFSTFAMQLATIGGTTKFSSGYPHFLEKGLQRHFGDGYLSVFGEGPCADINHWDISKPGPQIGYELATRPIGEKLAAGFLEKYSGLKENKAALAVSSKVVEVPIQTYSAMDLNWAKSFKGKPASALVTARVKKILALDELRQKYGETMPLEVQVFKLGDETAIVALPGQIFVELGLELKQSSPFETTLVVTLANNHEECIPLRKAFAEGSYEIVYSLVDSGGGEMLVETALSLLNEIKRR
jgi:hypothetical protein